MHMLRSLQRLLQHHNVPRHHSTPLGPLETENVPAST